MDCPKGVPLIFFLFHVACSFLSLGYVWRLEEILNSFSKSKSCISGFFSFFHTVNEALKKTWSSLIFFPPLSVFALLDAATTKTPPQFLNIGAQNYLKSSETLIFFFFFFQSHHSFMGNLRQEISLIYLDQRCVHLKAVHPLTLHVLLGAHSVPYLLVTSTGHEKLPTTLFMGQRKTGDALVCTEPLYDSHERHHILATVSLDLPLLRIFFQDICL